MSYTIHIQQNGQEKPLTIGATSTIAHQIVTKLDHEQLIQKIQAAINNADLYENTWAKVNFKGTEYDFKLTRVEWLTAHNLCIGALTITNLYLLYMLHTFKEKECPTVCDPCPQPDPCPVRAPCLTYEQFFAYGQVIYNLSNLTQ